MVDKLNFIYNKSGYEEELEVHHIKQYKDGGKHEESNLITLCRRCHLKEHGKQKRR